MSTIPSTERVPRISEQLALLAYALLDAHDETARLATDLAPHVPLGREALARASTGHSS
jgi:hypothetical protein